MRTKLFGVAYLFLSWFDRRIAGVPETHMHMRRYAVFLKMNTLFQARPLRFLA